MSNAKQKPIYRAKFCRIIGTDEAGKDKLGRTIEIGAVWSRREAGKGAILKLDIVPQDFTNGVLFLDPVEAEDRGFA
ncbi:MAG: hypothetical protein KJ587_11870 [Alphaproteobacteria bacterium]|nr:hypothetical protein [Alphaproteobacteria bacterium]